MNVLLRVMRIRRLCRGLLPGCPLLRRRRRLRLLAHGGVLRAALLPAALLPAALCPALGGHACALGAALSRVRLLLQGREAAGGGRGARGGGAAVGAVTQRAVCRIHKSQEAELDHRRCKLLVVEPAVLLVERSVDLDHVALELFERVPLRLARDLGRVAQLEGLRLRLCLEHLSAEGAVVGVLVEGVADLLERGA